MHRTSEQENNRPKKTVLKQKGQYDINSSETEPAFSDSKISSTRNKRRQKKGIYKFRKKATLAYVASKFAKKN